MNNYSPGRNRDKMLPKSSASEQLPEILVLQELMSAVTTAEKLVIEIASRFDRGDAAHDLPNRLAEQVEIIGRGLLEVGVNLPDASREAIAKLLSQIQAAVDRGDAWMSRTDVSNHLLNHRLRRAYGLIPRGP